MRLKENIIETIKSDNVLKNKLAIVLDKSYPTIQRYINSNNIHLTSAVALATLRDTLQLDDVDLLEN